MCWVIFFLKKHRGQMLGTLNNIKHNLLLRDVKRLTSGVSSISFTPDERLVRPWLASSREANVGGGGMLTSARRAECAKRVITPALLVQQPRERMAPLPHSRTRTNARV